jgi:hypothetical protein
MFEDDISVMVGPNGTVNIPRQRDKQRRVCQLLNSTCHHLPYFYVCDLNVLLLDDGPLQG